MSIFFDFDVGPIGKRFRKAIDQDKSDIESFCDRQQTDKLFAEADIGRLIELSTLSLCMVDESKSVMGFISLCDHPPLPGVDPAHWEEWVRNGFQKFYLSRNILFTHFMCCADAVTESFMEDAFASIFMSGMYLMQIILVFPGPCAAGYLTPYPMFKRRKLLKVLAKHEDMENCHCLYVAKRHDFCPGLKIRRAVEEDNDDIVEILDRKCTRLRELYGDYYISELISRHPESKRSIIVAQYQEKAVGVMCLNADINYDALQRTYELAPYHGLVKSTASEKEENRRANPLLRAFGESIMHGNWSPFDDVGKLEEALQIDDVPSKEKLNVRRQSKVQQSKVNFPRNMARRYSFDHMYRPNSDDYSDSLVSATSPSMSETNMSVCHLLEDEPFEYDIINIENSLLLLPEVSSLERILKTDHAKSQSKSNDQKFKRRRRSSAINIEEPQQVFDGVPDAFLVELYGLREDIDDRKGFYLLEAAFEIMSDFNYCIIRIPSSDKSFSMLQNFTFVPMRGYFSDENALYIAHRNSVLGKFRVRPAEIADIPQIAILLQEVEAKETLWTVEHSIMTISEHQAYVFMCGTSIIGVAILQPPEQIDLIRAKFTTEKYQHYRYHTAGQGANSGYCAIKTVQVYPTFEAHYRYFIRELMRLSGCNTLVWLTPYRNKWVASKANNLALAMVPLLPRTTKLEYGHLPNMKKICDLSKTLMPFSAWFISKRLTSLPRLNVDTRIVIVGASTTAMGFLNTLLFGDSSSYLTFTNVTLVSPSGLPYARHSNPASEMMFPYLRTNSDNFMKSTPYTYYVNIVHGTMSDLDKKEKFITLETGTKYYYDLLFIFIGRQYQHPDYMKGLWEKEKKLAAHDVPSYTRLDIPKTIETEPLVLEYDTPENVFIVNNITEANKALSWINNLYLDSSDNKVIIVYGLTIHAYCCVTALLEIGVPPEKVALVEPFPPEIEKKTRVPVFCNKYVDDTMNATLETLQVRVYRSHYFQSWQCDNFDTVTHVSFLSHFSIVNLGCAALFYYGAIGINTNAFMAICKSMLAYDGGILIDHKFRTNNPFIYAAGPVTRYHRRYFADTKRQKYYDSYEIGKVIGEQIRNQLDPLLIENNHRNSPPNSEGGNLPQLKLPELKKPRVIHCVLPGNLQYLEVRSPGMKIPHPYVQALEYNGHVMETFVNGYFKMHMNNDLEIDGITCLTPERHSIENFKNLYGQSAFALNKVHLRFGTKRIDNFYSFFREPWAYFLYQELFDEFIPTIKEIIPMNQEKDETLIDVLRFVSHSLGPEATRESIKLDSYTKQKTSVYYEAITQFVFEWLADNDHLWPLYLRSPMLGELPHVFDGLVKTYPFKRRRRSVEKMLAVLFALQI